MYKRVHFIALVPNYYSGSQNYTLYLFDKNEKIIVPIEITNREALHFLTGKIHQHSASPHIYHTLKKLLNFLQVKLISVTIYNFQDGIYYSYLNLVYKQKHIEMNVEFSDAFVLTKLFKSPIYMSSEILADKGIKITKKVIKDALKKDA